MDRQLAGFLFVVILVVGALGVTLASLAFMTCRRLNRLEADEFEHWQEIRTLRDWQTKAHRALESLSQYLPND